MDTFYFKIIVVVPSGVEQSTKEVGLAVLPVMFIEQQVAKQLCNLQFIIDSLQVFRPYAKHWLGPLLQLVVSGNNGGEGIHYMVVEIVVTILSWTSVATPKVRKYEIHF